MFKFEHTYQDSVTCVHKEDKFLKKIANNFTRLYGLDHKIFLSRRRSTHTRVCLVRVVARVVRSLDNPAEVSGQGGQGGGLGG